MWNYNLRKGTIWETKSFNECDEICLGMSNGTRRILLLSHFIDENNSDKFSYVKIDSTKKDCRNYVDIEHNGKTLHILIDELLTGNTFALNRYIDTLDKDNITKIVDDIKQHFSIFNTKLSKTVDTVSISHKNNTQKHIFKFGINVYVVENADVTLTKKNQIRLSDKAKNDILNCSNDEEDVIKICNTYKIYPGKAIKEIRNRLRYQYK